MKAGKQRSSKNYSKPSSESSACQTFRSQVLRLRNANDQCSVATAVTGLREAVLNAARVDAVVDDALLGMAASLCVRHKQGDLMGLLCAHALFRLETCSGRSVAELASAAVKLDRVEAGFARAVTGFCISSPTGTFASVRDIAMVAAAVRGFANVDHGSALCGLAAAAMPHLNDTTSQRDVADLLHQLSQLLFNKCGSSPASFLSQGFRVREVLCAALNHFKRRLHRSSAMDVAMVAGVIAGLWTLLESEKEASLKPCLLDIAQLARFRRAEFNAQDLANIAIAFAKVGLANADIADVLDEQTAGQLSKFSNKDVALLLCASSRLPAWSSAAFTKTVASQLAHRDLAKFSSQDLCSSAQSLSKLGVVGAASLQQIADEAFQRQLCSFTGNDKAILLWSLAKARSKHCALLRILVRALAVENFSLIDRDLASATIWALARISEQLPSDQWSQSLLHCLCALCPWVGAAPSELCCTVWAVGRLSAQVATNAWYSLLGSVNSLPPCSCSLHELCLCLCGLSTYSAQVDRDLRENFASEVILRIRSGKEQLSEYDKHLLYEASQNSLELPPDISTLIIPASEQETFCGNPVSTSCASENTGEESQKGPESYCRKCDQDVKVTLELDDIGQANVISHSHGHGQGHSHGYSCNSEEATDILTAHHSHGDGHAHDDCNGQGHGHTFAECTSDCGHDCCKCFPPLDLATPVKNTHGIQESELCTSKCCPAIFDSNAYGEVRLNAHCDFDGHCIQLKNTFIHVQCSHSDSESETDCMVCKITRSRSCDVMRRPRFDSRTSEECPEIPQTLVQPPGLLTIETSGVSESPKQESRGRRMRRQKRQNKNSESSE